eukprot:TRINITY_DN2035_c0_g1_i1.p1 TRINITY_DN2035_c0_g1~~TRINITY_DN2035_c0_g1_i1.p1  ORF type:complete len:930 (-),score=161.90 TRINITY_DN2035_c0_g1_i1:54-2456(-)
MDYVGAEGARPMGSSLSSLQGEDEVQDLLASLRTAYLQPGLSQALPGDEEQAQSTQLPETHTSLQDLIAQADQFVIQSVPVYVPESVPEAVPVLTEADCVIPPDQQALLDAIPGWNAPVPLGSFPCRPANPDDATPQLPANPPQSVAAALAAAQPAPETQAAVQAPVIPPLLRPPPAEHEDDDRSDDDNIVIDLNAVPLSAPFPSLTSLDNDSLATSAGPPPQIQHHRLIVHDSESEDDGPPTHLTAAPAPVAIIQLVEDLDTAVPMSDDDPHEPTAAEPDQLCTQAFPESQSQDFALNEAQEQPDTGAPPASQANATAAAPPVAPTPPPPPLPRVVDQPALPVLGPNSSDDDILLVAEAAALNHRMNSSTDAAILLDVDDQIPVQSLPQDVPPAAAEMPPAAPPNQAATTGTSSTDHIPETEPVNPTPVDLHAHQPADLSPIRHGGAAAPATRHFVPETPQQSTHHRGPSVVRFAEPPVTDIEPEPPESQILQGEVLTALTPVVEPGETPAAPDAGELKILESPEAIAELAELRRDAVPQGLEPRQPAPTETPSRPRSPSSSSLPPIPPRASNLRLSLAQNLSPTVPVTAPETPVPLLEPAGPPRALAPVAPQEQITGLKRKIDAIGEIPADSPRRRVTDDPVGAAIAAAAMIRAKRAKPNPAPAPAFEPPAVTQQPAPAVAEIVPEAAPETQVPTGPPLKAPRHSAPPRPSRPDLAAIIEKVAALPEPPASARQDLARRHSAPVERMTALSGFAALFKAHRPPTPALERQWAIAEADVRALTACLAGLRRAQHARPAT